MTGIWTRKRLASRMAAPPTPRADADVPNSGAVPVRIYVFALLVGVLMLGASRSAMSAEIKLDAELGQSVLEANKSQSVYLRLNLKTLAGIKERQRAPINVALVLDRSGSMQGARIVAAKEAARMALARLNRDDTLSVVMFNNLVDVLQPAGRVGERTEYVREKISAIKAEGGTAIYAGVSEGAAQVRRNLNLPRDNQGETERQSG